MINYFLVAKIITIAKVVFFFDGWKEKGLKVDISTYFGMVRQACRQTGLPIGR